jgi:hypothetical protein
MRRLFPPLDVSNQTKVAFGRSYTGTPGSAQDVNDSDAGVLAANGWTDVALSGATSARPTATSVPSAQRGLHFFDTTLNAMIVHDGANWRSPVDGSAV